MSANDYTRTFEHWGRGHRARRGDLRPLILTLLQEKPMHGYEIMTTLEENSHGLWRPSAGTIYPNLQLLEEQELVTSSEQEGKKIYTLTAKGKEEAETAAKFRDSHPFHGRGGHGKHFKDLKMPIVDIMVLLRQLASRDSEEKTEEAKKILSETKQKLTELAER